MFRTIVNPLRLLFLLPRRPGEFWDRASAILSSRWEASRRVAYPTTDSETSRAILSEALDADVAKNFSEPGLAEVSAQVYKKQALSSGGPFPAMYNGDSLLASFCYSITRSLKAMQVVETGVCYGVTSAHILKAMQMNGEGHLDSVDIPPLGKDADAQVGRFIPEELRHRWTLHRGTSAQLLGPLLSKLGSIDMFIHDSLHTYQNMRDEFAAAWPILRPGGVLVSDDVQGNPAFQELAARLDVATHVVIQEKGKDALFGVAVKSK
jgi:predicted O-methyltransferase YrrM